MTAANPAGTDCRHCGRPLDDVGEVVSRHNGADGETVYTRCVCGVLAVWLRPPVPARPRLLLSAPAPADPPGPASPDTAGPPSALDPARPQPPHATAPARLRAVPARGTEPEQGRPGADRR
ncbi:hypothetical protein CLV63_113179 [Murinocardiopsis flavida]|uniref:Uncharacterized protein n=1 Tax=Murinocardiopsis flavida TaxID=645275 RepID=A0A2P8DFN2_9ACTN|nr:hypothetical protein [Murinocardiopsis flavida]PSK96016.1 hypothetical protein CLV63_113179 [Murinocardiopsis flavida]